MGVTAAVVGVGLLAGGTVYQSIEATKARKSAEREAAESSRKFGKLESDLERQRAEERDSLETRNRARTRQRTLSRGGVSQRDTILTSPLGVLGEPNLAQKTLLGT